MQYAAAKNTSNKLSYRAPLQLLSGLAIGPMPQSEVCNMSGIQLAAGGSKGMRPSIDAKNLIMVDAASDAIGEQQARRYIHHEDNLSPKRFLLLYGACTVHS
jgi:NOL1/NOP2/fmu family ribosome biogenesis protein